MVEEQHANPATPAEADAKAEQDFMARYLEADARRRSMAPQIVQRAVHALREALVPGGITRITIRYDGYGDSGQIEDITLYRSEDALSEDDAVFGLKIEVPTYQQYTDELEERQISGELREVLDYLAMDIIDLQHGGWENEEGGYGEIRIDITAGDVEHAHNERIETVNQSVWSY